MTDAILAVLPSTVLSIFPKVFSSHFNLNASICQKNYKSCQNHNKAFYLRCLSQLHRQTIQNTIRAFLSTERNHTDKNIVDVPAS